MKIVQLAPIVPRAKIAQFAQSEVINLKSVESQNEHLEQIAIQKQNVLRNQIVQQR